MTCKYDCYQVTLQFNIKEEDSCMLNRYGPNIFSIKSAEDLQDCGCSSTQNQDTQNTQNQPTELITAISMPKAVILDITVDRCDCTKANLTLYVRLPCKNQVDVTKYNVDKITELTLLLIELIQKLISDIISYNNTHPNEQVPQSIIDSLYSFINGQNNLLSIVNNFLTVLNNIPLNCDLLAIAASSVIAQLGALILLLTTDVSTNNLDKDDTVKSDISAILTNANNLLQLMNVIDLDPNQEVKFTGHKFSLYTGTTGYERKITTFIINPLSGDIVSTGVTDNCTNYDITRVPMRSFDTTTINDEKYALCLNNKYIKITNDCGAICCPGVPMLKYIPDTLHITFPLTKDLKCLLPDFNLPGTYFNTKSGVQPTLVKIRSTCSRRYSFPAQMTFDKHNCSVCLEISKKFIQELARDSSRLNGYEHIFGCDCRHLFNTTNTCLKDGVLQTALADASDFFAFLSLSKKFEVVGVHKCVEKIFFTFQVIEVPYKSFCVDSCGCKANTVLPQSAESTNSYKILSDANDYTYEFSQVTPIPA